jgi:endonuclease/exonuclease/phosphatase family metal-dependent hydrolase
VSKLISWNIAGRVKARSAQLEWIASEQADIHALQEVAGASDLRHRLFDLGFKCFASTEPMDGRKKLVAIASREPFRVIPAFAVPHPERAISCRISLRSKEVELHCVHVPPGSIYGRVKIEFLEAVARGLSTRERPQLLVGDFNCPQFMEPVVVTWAQRRGKDGGWQLRKTFRGVEGGRWDAAERSILCPRADMTGAFRFLNRVAIDTYPAKARGGPNCFDHMIASNSIMPSTLRLGTCVLKAKLSDHAALVAEWPVAGGSLN